MRDTHTAHNLGPAPRAAGGGKSALRTEELDVALMNSSNCNQSLLSPAPATAPTFPLILVLLYIGRR